MPIRGYSISALRGTRCRFTYLCWDEPGELIYCGFHYNWDPLTRPKGGSSAAGLKTTAEID